MVLVVGLFVMSMSVTASADGGDSTESTDSCVGHGPIYVCWPPRL